MKLGYPPKTVPETVALSPELQAHLLLWPDLMGRIFRFPALTSTQPASASHHQLQGGQDRHFQEGEVSSQGIA